LHLYRVPILQLKKQQIPTGAKPKVDDDDDDDVDGGDGDVLCSLKQTVFNNVEARLTQARSIQFVVSNDSGLYCRSGYGGR